MDKFETEYERAAREQSEALAALQNALLETRLGKFLIWCVEGLNRLLNRSICFFIKHKCRDIQFVGNNSVQLEITICTRCGHQKDKNNKA